MIFDLRLRLRLLRDARNDGGLVIDYLLLIIETKRGQKKFEKILFFTCNLYNCRVFST